MHEILAADRADLPHCKEAGDGYWAKDLAKSRNVVVRIGKESEAAVVATEQEGSAEPRASAGLPFVKQQATEVLIGGLGVADVELDRLPDPNDVGDRDPSRLVAPDHVADQEVAALEPLLVFVDDPANVKPLLVLRGEIGEDFADDFQRRPAAQFANDVPIDPGHDHGGADGRHPWLTIDRTLKGPLSSTATATAATNLPFKTNRF